jgi:hypothetical protein
MPLSPDGYGQMTAMGGTRSNGAQPAQRQPGAPAMPAAPFLPNGGLSFTPRPAAAPQQGAVGNGLQRSSFQPAPQGSQVSQGGAPSAVNVGSDKSYTDPGLAQYSYTGVTGQKGGYDQDMAMAMQQASIKRAQSNLSGAVAGYGDSERQKLTQQVGGMLGEQNSIGGLRSGGVEQSLTNLGDQYGREIGDYAAQTAVQGQQQGILANDQVQSVTGAAQARRDAKHKGVMGAIGQGLGIAATIGGSLLGGPAGASFGQKLGAGLSQVGGG